MLVPGLLELAVEFLGSRKLLSLFVVHISSDYGCVLRILVAGDFWANSLLYSRHSEASPTHSDLVSVSLAGNELVDLPQDWANWLHLPCNPVLQSSLVYHE